MSGAGCPLCRPPVPATVLWSDERARVVLVDQSAERHVFPGFCRVIWNAHVAEMTDLEVSDRSHLMDLVWDVESAIRTVLQPHKINLASFGNMVPHLHWHIIPRWRDDSHFPESTWGNIPEGKLPPNPLETYRRLVRVPELQSELHRLRASRSSQTHP